MTRFPTLLCVDDSALDGAALTHGRLLSLSACLSAAWSPAPASVRRWLTGGDGGVAGCRAAAAESDQGAAIRIRSQGAALDQGAGLGWDAAESADAAALGSPCLCLSFALAPLPLSLCRAQ